MKILGVSGFVKIEFLDKNLTFRIVFTAREEVVIVTKNEGFLSSFEMKIIKKLCKDVYVFSKGLFLAISQHFTFEEPLNNKQFKST